MRRSDRRGPKRRDWQKHRLSGGRGRTEISTLELFPVERRIGFYADEEKVSKSFQKALSLGGPVECGLFTTLNKSSALFNRKELCPG